MLLHSPTHVTVGVTDADATSDFLGAFGFAETRRDQLDEAAAAMYGAARAEVRRLEVRGSDTGRFHLVEVAASAAARDPLSRGAYALDVYTRDMDRSIALATGVGGDVGPTGRYATGSLEVAETMVGGPDGLTIVLMEVSRRRPSVLDHDEGLLHSQVHSIVVGVDDVHAAAAPLLGAGLQVMVEFELRDPQVARFMGLPRDDVLVRLVILGDDELTPSRLELLGFPEDPGPAAEPLPLRAGGFLPGFSVDEVTGSASGLGHTIGSGASDGREVAVVGCAGGVTLELLGGGGPDQGSRS